MIGDSRSTDNAWLETIMSNFHDEAGTVLHLVRPISKETGLSYVWKQVTAQLNLRSIQKDMIEMVGAVSIIQSILCTLLSFTVGCRATTSAL